MGITVMTRTFNRHVSRAKRAALKGPVFITDRGQPAHDLLTFEDYQEIAEKETGIVELPAMPKTDSVELEPPRLAEERVRLPDLS